MKYVITAISVISMQFSLNRLRRHVETCQGDRKRYVCIAVTSGVYK